MPTLDPRIWVIAGLLLVLGIGATVEEIRIAALRGEVEQGKSENVAQREAVATLKVQLGEVVTNRDQLTATIEKQNRSIEQLRSDATAAEAAANVRALRVLQAGKVAAGAIDGGPGAAAFNTWLSGEFTP